MKATEPRPDFIKPEFAVSTGKSCLVALGRGRIPMGHSGCKNSGSRIENANAIAIADPRVFFNLKNRSLATSNQMARGSDLSSLVLLTDNQVARQLLDLRFIQTFFL